MKYHHNSHVDEKAKAVDPEIETQNPATKVPNQSAKKMNRLKIFVTILTIFGVALFTYLIYSVGFENVLEGIAKIGIGGFLILQFIYFLRIIARAIAWKLSVYEPYKLDAKDTLPAVIIGEAMSSMIPLGILVSGTSKAVAVRHRVPLVVGLSSIATENLFYSVITGIFVCFGSFAFLRNFELTESWILTLDLLIGLIILLILAIVFIVLKQWHFASQFCEWLYDMGFARKYLESGRLHVRLFENLIYGFYRKYPRRFLPIFLCQVTYHLLGILEAWFILSRIQGMIPSLHTAFLLESISRAITIFFKFVPFVIGIDEAGAQFVAETLALGVGVGVTIAIIRKGRIIFWTIAGLILIAKRGLSFKEFTNLKL